MREKRFLYDHGLPFSTKLAENMDDLVERVMNKNKAGMIIIDGGVGEGKTTLGVHLGDYAQGSYRNVGGKYVQDKSKFVTFDNQLAMGGEIFVGKVRMCFEKNLHVVIYDEGGDFNKRGSLTGFNMMLNRTFETYRAFKVLVIICLPSFHVLDHDLLLKNIPRLLLHLHSRNNNSGEFQGYSLMKMFYLADKMRKIVVKSFAYDMEDCNFRGHFLDLEPERMNELSDYSIRGKLDILKKAEVNFQGLVTKLDVSKKFNRSIGWVGYRFSIARIKPVKYINRIAYYSDECLNILSEPVKKGRG